MTASPMWPVEPKPDEDAEGSDDEAEIQLDPAMAAFQELPLPERLQQTFSHLRETHRYCLFCGHQVWGALLSQFDPTERQRCMGASLWLIG